jgi:hypothetical protein
LFGNLKKHINGVHKIDPRTILPRYTDGADALDIGLIAHSQPEQRDDQAVGSVTSPSSQSNDVTDNHAANLLVLNEVLTGETAVSSSVN